MGAIVNLYKNAFQYYIALQLTSTGSYTYEIFSKDGIIYGQKILV